MVKDETVIRNLNYFVKSYDALTKTISGIKARLDALNPDKEAKDDPQIKALEKNKMEFKKFIDQYLELFPIWNEWLKDVPGMGPSFAGRLLILYYYRFVPICKKCGADLVKEDKTFVCKACKHKAKGDGVLETRIEYKNFETVSSWWHYMGRHTVNGKMPKLIKNQQADWSTPGRTLGFLIGDQFIKQKNPTKYGAFYRQSKFNYAERLTNGKKISPMHKHNMARNKMIKLFLSHFWQIAREIEGLPVTKPYSEAILGHTGIIKPFYYDQKPSEP